MLNKVTIRILFSPFLVHFQPPFLPVFFFFCFSSCEHFKSASQQGNNLHHNRLSYSQKHTHLPLCFHQNTSYFSVCVCVCVHLQGVWLEGSRAARGNPDAATSVPISPVERCRLPPTSLLRRQQDQIWGTDLCEEKRRSWKDGHVNSLLVLIQS